MLSHQVLLLLINKSTFTQCFLQAEKAQTVGRMKTEDRNGMESPCWDSQQSHTSLNHLSQYTFVFSEAEGLRNSSMAWTSHIGQIRRHTSPMCVYSNTIP